MKNLKKKIAKIKGLKIESVKGTSQIELARIQKTAIPRIERHHISSKRGTDILKL